MKKIIFSIIVFACFIALMASMMLSISAISTEAEPVEYDSTEVEQLDVTDSYYYDRLSEEQKTYYTYLKEFLDTWDVEPGSYQKDFSHWLDADDTEADANQMVHDFMYAQIALHADEPLYKWKGGFMGGGAYCDFYGNIVFLVQFDKFEIYTDEVQARTDARISEIVEAIGEGDRYTKLRRMTTYFLDNTFYDPYLDQINLKGSWQFELRGQIYDSSAYGLFLEGVSMCDGFSQAVKVICNELNIPCIIMGNRAHAWNLVQMEDGKWYRLDITNACRLGWDGDLPQTLDEYFEQIFLRNNTLQAGFGAYDDPYMISLDNVPLVTEFPEHAEGQYVYTGSETDFSYAAIDNKLELGESKFIYRVNVDGVSCTIINHEGKESGDLIIPKSIDGYTVTAIAPYAFYYCSDFNGRLVIPDTVESIGQAAFAGCYGITSVEMSQSLHVIGVGAFIGLKGISNLELPSITGIISDYAFYDCNALNTVTFGDHVVFVGQKAFEKNYGELLIKAPADSAAEQYAMQNGVAFELFGEMCSLEKVTREFDDSETNWHFHRDEQMHYDVCKHGARFNYADHTVDAEISECGSECSDCGAYFCFNRGFSHTAPSIKNATEADCISPSYTGDLMCRCGRLLQPGQYVGEPTYAHVAGSDEWYYDEDNHYKKCGFCGWRLEDSSHRGGVATTTQRPHCEICGAEYGELLTEDHEHLPSSRGQDEHWHFYVCICGEVYGQEAHWGGTATETQPAICVVCGTAYVHIHKPIVSDFDQYGHYQICDCGEKLNFEAHYGGTATDDELPICVVCGVAYGHIHKPIVNGCDEYGHYQICDCGEMLNFEAHYGGTATEDQLALCEACGVAYGDFAVHIHNGENGFVSEENGHFKICTCGETFDFEPHYGGVATEYELALCEACGVAYGDFAEHVHAAIDIGYYEDKHFNICSCGLWMDEESHYGGTATTAQKAICVVCGVEYGDYAIDSPENNTEAPENNTEAPENNTEAPEKNTEEIESNAGVPDSNIKEPDSNNSAINAGLAGGCGSSVGVGLISLVTSLAAGYVILKKKKEN